MICSPCIWTNHRPHSKDFARYTCYWGRGKTKSACLLNHLWADIIFLGEKDMPFSSWIFLLNEGLLSRKLALDGNWIWPLLRGTCICHLNWTFSALTRSSLTSHESRVTKTVCESRAKPKCFLKLRKCSKRSEAVIISNLSWWWLF